MFRVQGLSLGFRVKGLGFRIWGCGFGVLDLGCKGFGFRVEGQICCDRRQYPRQLDSKIRLPPGTGKANHPEGITHFQSCTASDHPESPI